VNLFLHPDEEDEFETLRRKVVRFHYDNFGNETAKAKSFTVPRGCCNCGCPTKAYSTEACEVLAEMEAANDMLTYRELKQVLSDMLRAHFEERTVQAGG